MASRAIGRPAAATVAGFLLISGSWFRLWMTDPLDG